MSTTNKVAKTPIERQQESAERRTAQGFRRLNVWLSPARIAELDALIKEWQLADRTVALDAAIRFLAKQSPALPTLDLS
jgi:hypothetical protein